MEEMHGIPVTGANLPPQVIVPISMAMILMMRSTMPTLAVAGKAWDLLILLSVATWPMLGCPFLAP